MPVAVINPLKRNGLDLEETIDAIEDVHVAREKLPSSVTDATTTTTTEERSEEWQSHNFRDYEHATERVKNFYIEQHAKQTVEFNIQARVDFKRHRRARMGIWEAMEMLNTLIDDSDPDTSLTQIEHLLQTAEAIRRDGKPEWMQVVGLVHDLGKLLYFFGSEGQWDVVGDTFVVGCQFSDKIIYPGTMTANPDFHDPVYSTEYGVYKPNCGLDNVLMAWGHDEYLYQVLKDQCYLPEEGLAMIRYHSFYPWHREGAYRHLMCEEDYKWLAAAQEFNPYDLYSKASGVPNVTELRPYYQSLIEKFFPKMIDW